MTLKFEISSNGCAVCSHGGHLYVVRRVRDRQRWEVYADGVPLATNTKSICDAFSAAQQHAEASYAS